MQYAVIKSGGKQYKVNVGDVLEIDKIESKTDKVLFEEILLLVDGEKIGIGKPNVPGVRVEAKILEQKKGDKIRVMKFKAKSRYRKAIGFRPHLSVVKIDKIDFSTKNSAEKEEKTVKSAPKTVKTK